jgi:hypothetical protein
MEDYQSPYLAHIQDIYEAIGRLLKEVEKQETSLEQKSVLDGFHGNFTQDIYRFGKLATQLKPEEVQGYTKGYTQGVKIGSEIEEAFGKILVESGVFKEMTNLYFHEN